MAAGWLGGEGGEVPSGEPWTTLAAPSPVCRCNARLPGLHSV